MTQIDNKFRLKAEAAAPKKMAIKIASPTAKAQRRRALKRTYIRLRPTMQQPAKDVNGLCQ